MRAEYGGASHAGNKLEGMKRFFLSAAVSGGAQRRPDSAVGEGNATQGERCWVKREEFTYNGHAWVLKYRECCRVR